MEISCNLILAGLASLRTWYYFRLCLSFSCSSYDLILIKKSHASNFYSFTKVLIKSKNSLLVTVVVQFAAKTTNSEEATYFLSLMAFLIDKLKSHHPPFLSTALTYMCIYICLKQKRRVQTSGWENNGNARENVHWSLPFHDVTMKHIKTLIWKKTVWRNLIQKLLIEKFLNTLHFASIKSEAATGAVL